MNSLHKTTQLLAFACCIGASLSAAFAEEPPSVDEKDFREAVALPLDQKIVYRAEDGSVINFSDFEKGTRSGKAFTMDTRSDGAVELRLIEAPATEPPASAPKTLRAFDFKTLDGKRAHSGDTQGRPMILSFFFAECAPCIEEVPILNAFARKHQEYRYAAFTFDDASTATRFVQRYKLEWPVVADSRPFIDTVGVRAFPTYVLMSSDGKVLRRTTGLDTRVARDPEAGLKFFEDWVDAR